MDKTLHHKLLIGRHEWCQLPLLNIPAIKAKIDTGAKTSAIHAFDIEPFFQKHVKYVRFRVLPIQSNHTFFIPCKAPVMDERFIMSSNGHKEHRYVIQTSLKMGDRCWEMELTLSNRDPLRFRLLLGREALNNRVLIDPQLTCHQGKITKEQIATLYP